jgi:copper(I)-binding protein
MTRTGALAILAVFFCWACGTESGPPVAVSEVRVLAPVPGSTAGVAYFAVSNNDKEKITINGVRSPQFERIEIHETGIDDQGVSRMRRLQGVDVAAGETVRFAEGGKHLMLIGARPDTRAGSPVSLEIEHSKGIVIVSATLQDRIPAE